MARKNTPRRYDSTNPYEGQPGFWNGVNRLFYRVAGPSQVGTGRKEAAYVPPADPRCPLCGELMELHVIDRSGPRTQLYCPVAAA